MSSCIHSFMSWLGCEVIELNVQPDHVHMVAWILPKHSISYVMGVLKGRTSIRVFKKFPWMKQKPYWGNHFWAEGYCVDTVGLDEEKIRLYVKWQESKERRAEALAQGNPRQGLLNLKGEEQSGRRNIRGTVAGGLRLPAKPPYGGQANAAPSGGGFLLLLAVAIP